MTSKTKRPNLLNFLMILTLSFAIPLIFNPNFVRAADSCSQLFLIKNRPYVGDAKLDQIMSLLFYSYKGKGGNTLADEVNRYFLELWQSNAVKNYLAQLDISWNAEYSYTEKYSLLAQYVHFFLSQYRNSARLKSIEDQTLMNRLISHGAKPLPGETARKLLERISADNTKRLKLEIMGKVKHPDVPVEVRQLVDNLELFFAHNSHIMEEAPGYPLVAPLEIDKMGLKGFGMSTMTFNRFIGSDQFVYFKALFKQKNFTGSRRSEYGKYGVILKPEYAQEHILVSPFVMYTHQLHRSIKNINPEVAKKLSDKIFTTLPDGTVVVVEGEKIEAPDEIREAQKELHNLDFTTKDFEKLVKSIVLKRLQELYVNDFSAYQVFTNTLKSNDLTMLNTAILNLTSPYLNMGFEGVIGVAVPESNLIHFGP